MEKPAPSGIAQLRQSVDQRTPAANGPTPPAIPADPMNLDEFIIPSSIGSPAGIEPSQLDLVPSAIPIKARKEQLPAHNNLAPASLPYTSQDFHRSDEFGYVQRRVRKTSVDERKVGFLLSEPMISAHLVRLPASDPPSSPLKWFLLRTS